MDLPVAESCQEHDCQHSQQLAVELLGPSKVSTCWEIYVLAFGMVTCGLTSQLLLMEWRKE